VLVDVADMRISYKNYKLHKLHTRYTRLSAYSPDPQSKPPLEVTSKVEISAKEMIDMLTK
jgi:hypothetical protein